MKCGTLVQWVEKRKKGTGQPIKVARRWFYPGMKDQHGNVITKAEHEAREGITLDVCDGEIVVRIDAVDEPTWGASYARLDIDYKCQKCGATCFPDLPQNSDQLSKFVTDAIRNA